MAGGSVTEPAYEQTFELPEDEDSGYVPFMETKYAIDLWLDELARRGRSPRTIDSYRRKLYHLNDWLGPTVGVRDVTTQQLRRYLDHTAGNERPWNRGKQKAAGTRAIQITVINNFFEWLAGEQMIKNSPTVRNSVRVLTRPRLQRPEDNDLITSVTTGDVRKMLDACQDWDEKLCLYTLAYLGPRRNALAQAKITDYDPGGVAAKTVKDEPASAELLAAAKGLGVDLTPAKAKAAKASEFRPPTITFREKGAKSIAKPVPPPLQRVIEAARADGVYDQQDWLIPNRRSGKSGASWLDSKGRDHRNNAIVYRLVLRVAERAGVHSHVHALRAAFAVYFLEAGGDKYDLQLLMGHASGSTTDIYARRLDKKKRMESVLNLDWGDGS